MARPPTSSRVLPIELPLGPGRALSAWPDDWPLAALWSGGNSRLARWTVLARPNRVVRAARSLEELSEVLATPRDTQVTPGVPPFTGGWIGAIGYEFARDLEPAMHRTARRGGDREGPALDSGPSSAPLSQPFPPRPFPPGGVQRAPFVAPSARDDRGWPGAVFFRCDDAILFDHDASKWWGIGGADRLAETLKKSAGDATANIGAPWLLAPLRSTTGRERYLDDVRRVIELIRRGDVYQVNLAHRLTGEFRGSSRQLAQTLLRQASPWFGAYLELQPTKADPRRRAVLSMSPELLLEYDPRTRRAVTRPMKGTRPAGADPEELRAASKDRAELAMIVDLMRNDLGRVCSFGSVRVDDERLIEHHGGVVQAVAEISGDVRRSAGLGDLWRAVLPGGSVTGAPKIRAMQIIDELEPVARGPYCGCVGYVSDSGHAALSIAIRTAVVTGEPTRHTLDGFDRADFDYSVGAGIVAESDPSAEWRETLDKAGVLRGVAGVTESESHGVRESRSHGVTESEGR